MDTEGRRLDLAWAAGLYEGEGCFTISNHTSYGKKYSYPKLILTMTDEDIVSRFHKIIGGVGAINIRTPANRKTQWQLQVFGQEACDVVEMFIPFLGKRRLEQVAKVMDQCASWYFGDRNKTRRTHCVNGHEYTDENTMYRKDSKGRRCRQCKNESSRRTNERRKVVR